MIRSYGLVVAVLAEVACQPPAAAPRVVAPVVTPSVQPANQRVNEPAVAPDVLEQVRAATGGAAWASVHRLHISSTLRASGRDGHMDRWEDVEHGRFVRESDLPPRHRVEGFDGVSVWTSGDNDTAYVVGDEDAKLGAVDASYQVMRGWWFPERRAASRDSAGIQHEGTRTFDLVRITPEAGRPFVVWIDHASHVIDRIIEQQGESSSVTRFADYRRVGALTLPFTIRQGDGDEANDSVETVTSIEIDPAIPDERFALPPLPRAAVTVRPATAGSPVTIPFHVDNDKILIEVMLDGHGPYEAEFDTGGSLILPPAVIAELHLAAHGAAKQTGGGEGFVIGKVGRIGVLTIGGGGGGGGSGSGSGSGGGGAVVPHPSFDSFALFPDAPKRVLVGLETLQRYVVRLDFDTQRMTLTPPASFRYTGDGAIVPFVFQDNQPLVTGSVDGIAGTFAIDTGDNGSLLLMAPFAKRHGLVERYHATVVTSGRSIGATSGLSTRVSTVSFNGADGRPVASVDRPLARISTQTTGFDAHRYLAGNIGYGILHRFNVTFDYPRQRIIFEPNRHHAEPDIYSRSGVRFGDDPAGLSIVLVLPDSPAVDAKLEVGDVVTSIDGKPASSLGRGPLRALFKGPIGAKVRLHVRSKSGERDVVLVLRDVM